MYSLNLPAVEITKTNHGITESKGITIMKRKRAQQSNFTKKLNNMSIKSFFVMLLSVVVIGVGTTLIINALGGNEQPEPEEVVICDVCETEPCICDNAPACEICGAYPCICPPPEPEQPTEIAELPSICEICNEYPCICEDEPEVEDVVEILYYNPLTGMPTQEDISNNRPVAVMINNVRAGMPQHGTSRADIIYETLVEGSATRKVAIFQDVSDVGVIGSVRSARLFFVDVVQGHDAIYFHAGGSPEAIQTLRSRRMDNFNHTIVFYRDSGRRATHAYEHTLMTTGDRIMDGIQGSEFRTEHEPGYEHSLIFADEAIPPNGSPADRITVTFSAGKSTTFIYNEATNQYAVEQFGDPLRDGNDNTQLTVSNVIVIRTAIRVIDSAGRQGITTIGRGDGYLFTNGQYVEITWIREREDQPYRFIFEDGSPVVLNRGSTYICVIPTAQTVAID
jgi:hypothetical protein